MRCTQIIGLSGRAQSFMDVHAKRLPVCVCSKCENRHGGGFDYQVYDKVMGRMHGMFGDGPDLNEYTLDSGNKVREVVQASPWSSGPCIFLCLEDEEGNKMFEWTDDAINNC